MADDRGTIIAELRKLTTRFAISFYRFRQVASAELPRAFSANPPSEKCVKIAVIMH